MGKEVYLRMFDSDHSSYNLTQWSITWFVIFMNIAPIQYILKKQPTIET